MKIIQVSNSDIQGGAARAAYRLHRGLLALQQSSQVITLHKHSHDPTILQLPSLSISPSHHRVQQRHIDQNRTPLSNTSFTLPYPGLDLRHHPELAESIAAADVINLHWVAYFQSPVTIQTLAQMKPVVWTLHDMWAFTGGCHYSAGCDRYQHTCAPCPQLQTQNDLPAAVLQDRLDHLPNLIIVTPSQWLADCARKSRLFRHQRIEVIPNGLETDVFSPLEKSSAKQTLGLNPDAIALLIGADNGNEQRKGFAKLLQALQICLEHPQFQELINAQKFQLLSFGIPHEAIAALNLPIHSFGTLTDDTHLSQIYAAADLFVLPSLEDNFPNTMLESMSCGTPVVAFATGGMTDVVKDGITGRTVPLGDGAAMAAAILDCVLQPEARSQMGETARQMMADRYGLTVQAQQYLELYEDVIQSRPSPLPSNTASEEMGTAFAAVFYPLAIQAVETDLKETRQQSRQKLERSQAEAQELRDRVNAMETSKFWKLRQQWIRLKQFLTRGLGS
jgi:glycosyltransferase involved in cell wall biosynthesis